jgi:hypothetical protein
MLLRGAWSCDNRRRPAVRPSVGAASVILRSGGCHEEMSFAELWHYAMMLKLLFKKLSAGSKVLEFKVDVKTSLYVRCICQNIGHEHINAKPRSVSVCTKRRFGRFKRTLIFRKSKRIKNGCFLKVDCLLEEQIWIAGLKLGYREHLGELTLAFYSPKADGVTKYSWGRSPFDIDVQILGLRHFKHCWPSRAARWYPQWPDIGLQLSKTERTTEGTLGQSQQGEIISGELDSERFSMLFYNPLVWSGTLALVMTNVTERRLLQLGST